MRFSLMFSSGDMGYLMGFAKDCSKLPKSPVK